MEKSSTLVLAAQKKNRLKPEALRENILQKKKKIQEKNYLKIQNEENLDYSSQSA